MSQFIWLHGEQGATSIVIVNLDEIVFIDSPIIRLRDGSELKTCEPNEDIWKKMTGDATVTP